MALVSLHGGTSQGTIEAGRGGGEVSFVDEELLEGRHFSMGEATVEGASEGGTDWSGDRSSWGSWNVGAGI